ncbi:MAG TPA: hypothetical protein VGO61_06120, partial [Steroidobacteraceae bacterium]|nr:hypothetical protein [Steroidobacteraceae bacterium]
GRRGGCRHPWRDERWVAGQVPAADLPLVIDQQIDVLRRVSELSESPSHEGLSLLGARSREAPVGYATIGDRFNNCLPMDLE